MIKERWKGERMMRIKVDRKMRIEVQTYNAFDFETCKNPIVSI